MPTIDDLHAAAERIRGLVHRTPTMSATGLGELFGVRLYVKAETLQRTGSFKLRGALNAVLSLPDADRARGLVAISAGNHAAALAYAARAAGTTATIVMPATANPAKIAATESYGGTVVLTEDVMLDAMESIRAERGLTLVHPFDDPNVVAGAGTVGLEILEDVPEPDVVIVQVGGGGLISGVATAVKSLRRNALVYGVEPEGADIVSRSLASGTIETMRPASVADGLCAPISGVVTMPIIRSLVTSVARVSDDDIRRALRLVLERTKLVVEGAGATGVAALVAGAFDIPKGSTVVVVATGGNVDAPTLARLLG
ncbi:MAG: threonine dehydratase [Frankiaceae bacterium]|jgi:threonine dehydratase|nr:threonine dehydratase [Frankiaceae bacterium]